MVTFAIDPRKSAVVAIDLQNCNVEKSPIAAPLGLQVVDKLNLLAAHYRAAGCIGTGRSVARTLRLRAALL